eukprot:761040-Hanusia_phi.AAC.3
MDRLPLRSWRETAGRWGFLLTARQVALKMAMRKFLRTHSLMEVKVASFMCEVAEEMSPVGT